MPMSVERERIAAAVAAVLLASAPPVAVALAVNQPAARPWLLFAAGVLAGTAIIIADGRRGDE